MATLPSRGIDISEFNGNVNIAALKGQISFVLIRCGYGSDYESQDDTEYEANVRKCEEAGIPYGVYLYSYARNSDMAKSEAAHTLRLLKGKKPLYGVWYDVEDSTLPTGETLIDDCITYCDAIQKAGYYCGLYSFLYWMEGRLNSPRLNPYDKWIAQWNNTLDYKGSYGIWQYSDSGVLNGAVFDMNYAYKDYPAIIGGGGDDTDMTREEVAALARQEAQMVYDQNETKYKTIGTLPNWAKKDVEMVYDELHLKGVGDVSGDTEIDASYTYVRALTVIAKVLQKMDEEEAAEKAAEKA